jgi:hypothetical protein
MTAKINTSFKSHHAPPFMVRDRNTPSSWKLAWDQDFTLSHSDIHRSLFETETTTDLIREGKTEEAVELALSALEHDPKNLKLIALINEPRILSYGSPAVQFKLKTTLKKCHDLIAADLQSLREGLGTLNALPKNNALLKKIDEDFLGEEICRMTLAEESLSKTFHECFAGTGLSQNTEKQQDILQKICDVYRDITQLKEKKPADDTLWAHIAGSFNFMKLISTPHINSLLNNFYNHDTRSKEDPRLVQLALISLLARENLTNTFVKTSDTEKTVSIFRKLLSKELNFLSNRLENQVH